MTGAEKFDATLVWPMENWHVCPRPWTRTVREQFGVDFATAVKVLAEARRRGGCE